MDRLSEIRARCEAATPGPWKWDLRTATHQCKLVTDHSGQYYVMDFARWGMHDACPTFQVYDRYTGPVTERGSHGMVRADKLAKSYPNKEHHRGFDDYIDHPDAKFIAHAREDIPYLLAEMEQSSRKINALECANRRAYDDGFNDCKKADDRLIANQRREIAELIARAEKAEAERDAAKSELCKCCHAFSDATGYGWDGDCEVCKFRPLPEPPKGE